MWLAATFVLLSVAALAIVGILVLVFQRATVDITFGVLILAFWHRIHEVCFVARSVNFPVEYEPTFEVQG